ncbi:ATP-binding protein [Candidatus Woesearchaeota archaeon]|nr:ATP-binding protein [Candidatus Woesearchaeota archaeon]
MVMKDELRSIVAQQKAEGFSIEGTVRRDILDEILKWLKDSRVLILTGVRRSGKSTILKQLIRETKDYCYVNFEDERFMGFKAQDFEQLNETLIEMYGNPRVYFFDEVQNIERFEAFVRRLQDQGKKVVITGSNASLLSKELGTRLTGRYKPFEIYPFSFKEYLSFNKLEPQKDWSHITEKKVTLIRMLDDYIKNGGMPEYLKNKDKEYVKTVYENILYRDIIARYNIRRQKILKELVNILTANTSAPFTYNSLKTSLGLANSITVKEYISYLNNSFLFFELQKFDFSIRKQLNSPKKAYVIDPAFSHITGFNISANKGRLLENAVFLELKRKNKEVYYYSGKGECDFLIKEETKISEAIQVCYALDKSNKERETSGLTECMEKFKLKKGIIITHEQEEEIKTKGKTIKLIPAFKWLLKL